ncbi:transposase [Caballeronia sp. SEWSISQ10-4 2]|uniref:transposase n=1 Tax=Caballeronia sp. SEWSISQ10-4 2 TaxID=2937438 RepID=UPI00264D631D|nr:transposase [Caballeronia sp. SEWSISQ10-4 2]MDN7178942.1 transposase [Caballeronia sp. SEWSISQ10-4 2]
MKPYRDMSDEEWQMVAPLLPELRPRSELRGRPLANTRAVLNGVLWVTYSGASWSSLPRKYPLYQTCHRRFKAWHESGVLARVMQQLFDLASEGLYALMTSRMRVPIELPEGFGERAGHAIGIDPTRSGSVSGDARTVLVPLIPLMPAAPVEYVNDGARHAA